MKQVSKEISVDNFAGGGGASTGYELATGQPITIAINHDPDAILMHETNHPYTEHYCENVWNVDPVKVCAGRPVALAWFSPDCKHFSKAKGGKPVSKDIRGLAWVAVRWAALVRPRVIMLENVEEFKTWGPLVASRDPKTGRCRKVDGYSERGNPILTVAKRGERIPIEQQQLTPDRKRAGATFKKWLNQLKSLGYEVELRELRACDYGAPTIRKRLFMIARCDGRPIVWPEPTHGAPDSAEVLEGRRKPWRTAAEIIDWSLPCPSIFDTAEEIKKKYGIRAQRPLAEATMRRIARGIQKYVIDNPEPFIVSLNHTAAYYQHFRGQSIHEPLSTITAKHGYGVVTPYVTCIGQNGFSVDRSRPVDAPLNTTVSKAEQCVVTPTLIQYHGEQDEGEVRGQSLESPLLTIDGANRYGMAAATLVQMGYGEAPGQQPRVPGIDKPLGTVVSKEKHALVTAFLSKYYDGGYTGAGSGADEPLSTITTVDHNAIVAANLVKFQQNSIGQEPDAPLHTCTTATRFGVVASHLVKMRGTNIGQDVGEPLQTITAQGTHYGLVSSNMVILRNNTTGQKMDKPLNTITTSPARFAEVRSFLIKYYGTATGQKCTEPLHTITSDDRFGIVTIHGVDYAIVDIGLRMLTPRELFNANGFPEDYIIDRDYTGTAYSKTKQVNRCGNAVPPQFTEALVRANLPELCGEKITTMAEWEEQLVI